MTARLADPPVLETRHLTLRAPRMEDFDAWAAFVGSDRGVFIGGPLDLGNAWRGFAHVAGMWALRGYGSFVFCLRGSDAPLGMTGPWHPADWPEREIGWTVWDAAHEGKGLAFEAATAARAFAYGSLGWPTAVSYIARGNARSVALAARLGARLDPDAAHPHADDPDVLVYRPPAPEAA
jgi:RimJ/RimL family protein N-acetyltransferase